MCVVSTNTVMCISDQLYLLILISSYQGFFGCRWFCALKFNIWESMGFLVWMINITKMHFHLTLKPLVRKQKQSEQKPVYIHEGEA